jgi:hypothetical protein
VRASLGTSTPVLRRAIIARKPRTKSGTSGGRFPAFVFVVSVVAAAACRLCGRDDLVYVVHSGADPAAELDVGQAQGVVEQRQEAERHGQPPVDFVFAAANSDTVIAQVRAGEVDLGFIEGPRVPTGLAHRVVGRDEPVVVVRPDHPWARRRRDLISLAARGLAVRSVDELGVRQPCT